MKNKTIWLEHVKTGRKIRFPEGVPFPANFVVVEIQDRPPYEPGPFQIDPRKRLQSFSFGAFMASRHPDPGPGICHCGCAAKLAGRRRRWASKACMARTVEEYNILKGDSQAIRVAVYRRDRGICANCGVQCRRPAGAGREFPGFEWRQGPEWQADHIIEVDKGGGGTPLDNFQLLCRFCHAQKTAAHAAERAERKRKLL